MRRRAVSSKARTGAGETALRCSRPLGECPVDDLGDFLAAKDADDVIDLGHFLQQVVLLSFGQATGHDDGPDAALSLRSSISRMTRQRFLPGRLDEAAGVDHDDVGTVGSGTRA